MPNSPASHRTTYGWCARSPNGSCCARPAATPAAAATTRTAPCATAKKSGDSVPVLLPPNLAELANRLIAQPPRRFGLHRPHEDGPTYLFLGRPPTRPMSAAALETRLRQHGIAAGAARNTALIARVAELPAPVIAYLFGLNRKTAPTWSTYAHADWTAYLTSRPHPDADAPR
jgi:hypothetical protein